MKGFVQGVDRQQATLLPEYLDDWVDESNPVRAVDVFVDALELRDLGFDGVDPAATGRPGYHPSAMLKLYIFGYLNRVQSSRRLEREAGRNLEVMWLTGRLVPDHKTIADFRKDNGPAIKKVCAQFVALCRKMGRRDQALSRQGQYRCARLALKSDRVRRDRPSLSKENMNPAPFAHSASAMTRRLSGATGAPLAWLLDVWKRHFSDLPRCPT